MNTLKGIILATIASTLAWVIVNFIALGTQANYPGVLTVGIVSGVVVGIGCAVFKFVNPIFMGIVVTLSACVGFGAFLIHLGVANVPELSLELVWIAFVMSLIGAVSGFGYKIGARV